MVEVGKGIQAAGTACAKARGLRVSLEYQQSWAGGAGETAGARPPRSACRLAPSLFLGRLLPHAAALHLASAPLVFVLSQSRGLLSTRCPARATGSVSPAWTPTRCLLLPRSSWTSCSTPTGRAPSGVRGCRVGQGGTLH